MSCIDSGILLENDHNPDQLVPVLPVIDISAGEQFPLLTGILYQIFVERNECTTQVKYMIDRNFKLRTPAKACGDPNESWCLIPVTVGSNNDNNNHNILSNTRYRIKNAQTGRVITCDGVCCVMNGAFMSLQPDDTSKYTNPKRLWKLIRTNRSTNKYELCNESTQHRISLGPIIGSDLLPPYIRCSKVSGDLISFCMTSTTLHGEILSMNFDLPIPQILATSTENILISSHVIRNQTSNSTHTESITHTITRTCSFTYSFKQSLKCLTGFSFKAEIPFISNHTGSNIDIKAETGGESHQEWTKTRQETYSLTKTITVPPHECLEVKSFVKWIENLSIPFKAKLKISGRCNRLRSDGGQIIENNPMDTDLIKRYLLMNQFHGNTISLAEDRCVTVEIQGLFKGSYGLGTDTELNNI